MQINIKAKKSKMFEKNIVSIVDQTELMEINHIIQSRKDTPTDSYIELDTMIKRVNNNRKKVK